MKESIPFTVATGTPVIVRFRNLDGEEIEMRVGLVIQEVLDSGDPEDDKNCKRYTVEFNYSTRTKVVSPAVHQNGKDIVIQGLPGSPAK